MKKNEILFIAEIGNNHNGDLDRAKRLIEICAQIGCNVAKFQLRDFNTLYRKTVSDVEDFLYSPVLSLAPLSFTSLP